MSRQRIGSVSWGRWLSLGGSIVAPATLITALLFYFGYVSSRAQYDYFGVDVDTVGLSTQDYVMRSPQPLLVPLLVLTLLAGGFLAAHLAARRQAAVHPSFRSVAKGLVAGGLILLGLGVALLFGYAVIGDWAYYPILTPLILAAGGTLAAYGITTIRWMDRRAEGTSVRSALRRSGRSHLALARRRREPVLGHCHRGAVVGTRTGEGAGTEPRRTSQRDR